jgi:hypothetical protein
LFLFPFLFPTAQRIRAALRSIQKEIRVMDLRTGVLQSQILSSQRAGVRKKRKEVLF